jgi:succinate-semialdehyde dehydrogenase/glutarate-semialdehyde dehydrogenase
MTAAPKTNTSALVSTNPAENYAVLGSVPMSTKTEVSEKVAAAKAAFPAWRDTALSERLKCAGKLRDLFIENKKEIAEITTKEMGMPMTQSLFTVDRAVAYMDWALANAESALAPVKTYESDTEINHVVHLPRGVLAAISPWNFPASNFVWATFQYVIAGNTIVFKNSEEVQLTAQLLEKLINASGFPKGVFNVIYGDGEVAQALIADDIDMINFTGSTRVGQILAKQAGEKFIPAVLELGGSDPAVVFADANIQKTVQAIYAGRFTNCGQICRSAKRLVIHENIVDDVLERLQELIQTKTIGNPMDENTDIGPLAAERQQKLLMSQVEDAKAKGATILCGGYVPDTLKGSYYAPTIITGITDNMEIWKEEVFGPVLPVRTFHTYEEAMELANDSIYGLGASVYTEDKKLAKQACHDIESGMVKVNTTEFGRPENPFGGVKLSGMGRENGVWGFHDACITKVIAEEK